MGYNYPHFDSAFIQGLYNWQSLIGASLALFAALLGAWYLWDQTQTSKRQEADRRARRFGAARATMPHILSEVINYLEMAMEWMCTAHPLIRQDGALPDPPAFPTTVLDSLERMIEATLMDEVANSCAEILSELQTFRARIQSLVRVSRRKNHVQVGLDLNLEDYMLQAAKLHYKIGLLFPFARDEQDNVADHLTGTSTFGSLTSLGCDELAFSKVFQRANEIDRKRLDASRSVTDIIKPEPAATAES